MTTTIACPHCGGTELQVHEELRKWVCWGVKEITGNTITLNLGVVDERPDDGSEFTGTFTMWCTVCDNEFALPEGFTVEDD